METWHFNAAARKSGGPNLIKAKVERRKAINPFSAHSLSTKKLTCTPLPKGEKIRGIPCIFFINGRRNLRRVKFDQESGPLVLGGVSHSSLEPPSNV